MNVNIKLDFSLAESSLELGMAHDADVCTVQAYREKKYSRGRARSVTAIV